MGGALGKTSSLIPVQSEQPPRRSLRVRDRGIELTGSHRINESGAAPLENVKVPSTTHKSEHQQHMGRIHIVMMRWVVTFLFLFFPAPPCSVGKNRARIRPSVFARGLGSPGTRDGGIPQGLSFEHNVLLLFYIFLGAGCLGDRVGVLPPSPFETTRCMLRLGKISSSTQMVHERNRAWRMCGCLALVMLLRPVSSFGDISGLGIPCVTLVDTWNSTCSGTCNLTAWIEPVRHVRRSIGALLPRVRRLGILRNCRVPSLLDGTS